MSGPYALFASTGIRARFTTADATDPSTPEEADDQAVLQVVSIWLSRLQLISVVTTFFAGMDGTFLGFTAPFNEDVTSAGQLIHASLAGALVLHLFAAIISYIASFALIRFQLVDAEGNEITQSAPPSDPEKTPRQSTLSKATANANAPAIPPAALPASASDPLSALTGSSTSTSSRIRVSQVRLFSFSLSPKRALDSPPEPAHPPIALLLWVHTVCIALSSAGFVLAVLGVMSYVWRALALSVSVFTTVCLGIGFLALGSVLR